MIEPSPRPAGPLLRMALALARQRFERECLDLVRAGMEESGLPEGTTFDSERMVWMLPPIPSE